MFPLDLPTTLELGNVRAATIYCVMTVIFFTVVGVFLYVFLTRETSLGSDLDAVMKRKVAHLSRRKALLILLPLWIIACGWFYNATLGDRFHELRHRTENGNVVWDFIYEYPHRVRSVPAGEVAKWTGQVGWERRSYRHALWVELNNGRVLRSAGLHPAEFAEKARVLELWGVKVLPDDLPDPDVGAPRSPRLPNTQP